MYPAGYNRVGPRPIKLIISCNTSKKFAFLYSEFLGGLFHQNLFAAQTIQRFISDFFEVLPILFNAKFSEVYLGNGLEQLVICKRASFLQHNLRAFI